MFDVNGWIKLSSQHVLIYEYCECVGVDFLLHFIFVWFFALLPVRNRMETVELRKYESSGVMLLEL